MVSEENTGAAVGTTEMSETTGTLIPQYSPLKTIHIKNFKNLENVIIDFTQSPIVALEGLNEAGKSSVIDALAVVAYNAYENAQKGFIKLGTPGFGIQLTLMDGTVVTRLKRDNVNYYEIKYPNGTSWSTDKLIRGEGVPLEVEKVMGCIRESETKELLHVRTYKDLLLFINTPNSANYKMMYEALKVENISRAIKRGSTEANEIKAWLATASVQRESLVTAMNGIKVLDIEPIVNVKERLRGKVKALELATKAQRLVEHIAECKRALGGYEKVISSGISEIDTVTARLVDNASKRLTGINMMHTAYGKLASADTVDYVDIGVTKLIVRATTNLERNTRLSEEYRKYEAVDDLGEASQSLYTTVRKVKDINERLKGTKAKLEQLSEVEGLKEVGAESVRLGSLSRTVGNKIAVMIENKRSLLGLEEEETDIKGELKDMGATVVTCDKCGNMMIVEVKT